MTSPRVVITGFGAVSPLGLTAQDLWQGLSRGQCGIGPITAFDPARFTCKLAGQVPDYKIREFIPKSYRKAAKLMSRDIELSVMAADGALRHAGLITRCMDPDNINIEPKRTAIILGAGLISCDLVELAPAVAASSDNGKFDTKLWGRQGIEYMTPLWLLKYLPNMLACHIGIIHDLQGLSNSITCAEASGHLAVIEAAQIIRRNQADAALAGGAEAKVNPLILIRQCLLGRATTAYQDQPEHACRPFDAQASGSVFGEGAGIIALESDTSAERRHAKIHATIEGWGQSHCLGTPYERIEPEGKGIRIAVQKALDSASLTPDDIDLIVPHGTGIPHDDAAESKALEAVFGPALDSIAVLPTKSMLSNTGAAAGALDLITAVQAMDQGLIPAAQNCSHKAAGCRLNLNSRPLEKTVRHALCCSYTYGGQTAALIVKNPQCKA